MSHIKPPFTGKRVQPTKGTDPKDRLLSGGQIEDGFLYVTNGELVMRFPIHAASRISEGYVPREALLHIERDQAEFFGNKYEIRIGKTPSRWKRNKPNEYYEGETRTVYSRFEPVFDPRKARQFPRLAEEWPTEREGMSSITVDTKELRSLALAIGVDKVRIEFDPAEDDGRLVICGRNGDSGAGVAMQPWRADA